MIPQCKTQYLTLSLFVQLCSIFDAIPVMAALSWYTFVFLPRNRLGSMYLPLESVIKIASAWCLLRSLCPRERRCSRNSPSSFEFRVSVSYPESELDSLSNGTIGMGVLYSGRPMGGVAVCLPVLRCSTSGMVVVAVVDWGSATGGQCNGFDGRCPWGCRGGCLVPLTSTCVSRRECPRDIGGEVPASDLSISWDDLTVPFTPPSRAIGSAGTAEGAGDGASVKPVERDARDAGEGVCPGLRVIPPGLALVFCRWAISLRRDHISLRWFCSCSVKYAICVR